MFSLEGIKLEQRTSVYYHPYLSYQVYVSWDFKMALDQLHTHFLLAKDSFHSNSFWDSAIKEWKYRLQHSRFKPQLD
jgi:hypothetical protein